MRGDSYPPLDMTAADLELLCAALLDCRAGNAPKAVRVAAAAALDQAVSPFTAGSVLAPLVAALALNAAKNDAEVADQVRVLPHSRVAETFD